MTGKDLGAQPAFPVIGVPGYGASVPVALPGGQQEWAECGGGLTKREWLVGQLAGDLIAEARRAYEGYDDDMTDGWQDATLEAAHGAVRLEAVQGAVRLTDMLLEELAK